MALTNMRVTREERKHESMLCESNNQYPYGLSLYLDNDTIEKLRMGWSPDIGTKLTLTAIVEVTSVSQNATQEGSERNIGLQITDMGLDSIEPAVTTSIAERLYAAPPSA